MKKNYFVKVGYKYINVNTIRTMYFQDSKFIIKYTSISSGTECEKFFMAEQDALEIIDKIVKGRLL